MNKQVVIAGILGAAAAQEGCKGPFVTAAKEAQASLEAEKVALDAKTKPLEDAAATELALVTAAQKRVTDQAAIAAPFATALAAAKAKVDVKVAAKTAASSEITAIGLKITAAAAA